MDYFEMRKKSLSSLTKPAFLPMIYAESEGICAVAGLAVSMFSTTQKMVNLWILGIASKTTE